MAEYFTEDFKTTNTYADNKAITVDEHRRALAFVKRGEIIGSYKKSASLIKQQLAEKGYNKELHHTYTFKFSWNNKDYAPDIRHIYIQELDYCISIL